MTGTEFHTATMARVYAQQGHYRKAADIYRHILSNEPDREDIAAELSRVEQQLDNTGLESERGMNERDLVNLFHKDRETVKRPIPLDAKVLHITGRHSAVTQKLVGELLPHIARISIHRVDVRLLHPLLVSGKTEMMIFVEDKLVVLFLEYSTAPTAKSHEDVVVELALIIDRCPRTVPRVSRGSILNEPVKNR